MHEEPQKEGVLDGPPSPEMCAAIDKAMESLKDRDFGGYYLSDEPECRGVSPVYLRHCYEYIAERDPYHVVYIASRDAARYIDCCDVVEPHPYLCPYVSRDGIRKYGLPLDRYGDHIAPGVALGRADKVIGNIPFAFAYRNRDVVCDFATFDEYVASAWAVIAEGAKTLYPFIKNSIASRPGLYEGVRYANTSVRALEDYLLFGERTRLAKDVNHVVTRWRMPDGRRMFAVVNFHETTYRARFRVGKGVYYEFRGERTFRNVWGTDEVSIDLGPFETVVATTEPVGTELATAETVRALVHRQELERIGRDNQILGREAELSFRINGRTEIGCGLIDGVRDQTAYLCVDAKQPIEISFPREPIRFTSLRLFGDGIGKAEVSVFNDGKWRLLQPSRRLGTYQLDLAFDETVVAEKVRLSVPWRSELFEIEFPYLKGE